MRALAIRERAAGPEHPYTALVVFALGEVAAATERFGDAADLFARVVTIRAQRFGPGHSSVASALTRAGIAYRALGRTEEAEGTLEAALRIWRRAQYPIAEELRLALENAVALYKGQGRRDEAIALEREVVALTLREGGGGRLGLRGRDRGAGGATEGRRSGVGSRRP